MVEWFTLIGLITTLVVVFITVAKLIEFILDNIVHNGK